MALGTAVLDPIWRDMYGTMLTNEELIGTQTNPLVVSSVGPQKEIFMHRLSTTGNGDGLTNMAVDGSVTPVTFYIQPPAGEIWRVARWMIQIIDTKNFDVGGWGSLSPLTNGLTAQAIINGITSDLISYPLHTNGDIAGVGFDFQLHTFGNTEDILLARWTFTKMGQFFRLNGDNSDKLQVTIQDNISALSAQYIVAQGYKE